MIIFSLPKSEMLNSVCILLVIYICLTMLILSILNVFYLLM